MDHTLKYSKKIFVGIAAGFIGISIMSLPVFLLADTEDFVFIWSLGTTFVLFIFPGFLYLLITTSTRFTLEDNCLEKRNIFGSWKIRYTDVTSIQFFTYIEPEFLTSLHKINVVDVSGKKISIWLSMLPDKSIALMFDIFIKKIEIAKNNTKFAEIARGNVSSEIFASLSIKG